MYSWQGGHALCVLLFKMGSSLGDLDLHHLVMVMVLLAVVQWVRLPCVSCPRNAPFLFLLPYKKLKYIRVST